MLLELVGQRHDLGGAAHENGAAEVSLAHASRHAGEGRERPLEHARHLRRQEHGQHERQPQEREPGPDGGGGRGAGELVLGVHGGVQLGQAAHPQVG
jgi:hypothetical protein